MLDFSFADPRLLFPNITESLAQMLEGVSTAWYFISFLLIVLGEWQLFKKLGEKIQGVNLAVTNKITNNGTNRKCKSYRRHSHKN